MRTLLAVLGLAVATAAVGQEMPRLAVMDFAAHGGTESLSGSLGGVVANELSRLGLFQVSTSEAVRSLIAVERQRQLVGCAGEQCADGLSALTSMDFAYVVTGKVSRLPGDKSMPTTFTLELTLLNAKAGRREGSDIQAAFSEAELTGKVPKAVIKLVTQVMNERSGSLLLEVSEAGAVVKVDDTVVGTTPVQRLTLASGPHFLQVEKEGFVSFQKELRITPNQLSAENVVLVPSPDYIARYESRAFQLRLGAWSAAAVAAGGAAAGAYFQWQAMARYGSADREGTFAYHRAQLLQGIETEGDVDHRFLANQLRSEIDRNVAFSWIGFGGAAVAAATSAVLFVIGDPPGRYQKFQATSAKPAASAFLVPAEGGAVLGISGAF